MSVNGVTTQTAVTTNYGSSAEKNNHNTEQTKANDTAVTVEISTAGRQQAQLYKAGDIPEMDRAYEQARQQRATYEGHKELKTPPTIVSEPNPVEVSPVAVSQTATYTAAVSEVANTSVATSSATVSRQDTSITGNNSAPKYETQTSIHGNDVKWSVTYDVYEDSFLRNVHNTDNRDSYYRNLFFSSFDNANLNLENFTGCSGKGGSITSIDSVVSRYEDLLNEITKEFGHDSDLMANNLKSLEEGFTYALKFLSDNVSRQLRADQQNAYYNSYPSSQGYESNRIGTHRDFNYEEFKKNSNKLMEDLAASFLKERNSGTNSSDALKKTMDLMNNMFGKTNSVNNLSFNDFFVLQKSMDDSLMLALLGTDEPGALLSERNKSFNNSTEISSELRALIG